MSIQETYQAQLRNCPGPGQRNAHLLGVCSNAVRAGRTEEQAAEDIGAAWGYGEGEREEVRHAFRSAIANGVTPFTAATRPARRPSFAPLRLEAAPAAVLPGAATFTRRMADAGRGADFATLRGLSPVAIPSGPSEQTRAYLAALFRPDDFVFAGDVSGRVVKTVSAWLDGWARPGAEPPPLVSVNALTGREGRTKDGKPSFRSADCVAVYRYALAEFDSATLPEQCAFWAGVIRTGLLPLRALTFSGHKSIHAILELRAGGADDFTAKAGTLRELLANPGAEATLRADPQCFTAIHTARLAGARRLDNGKPGPVQSLLWLSSDYLRPPAKVDRAITLTTEAPPAKTVNVTAKSKCWQESAGLVWRGRRLGWIHPSLSEAEAARLADVCDSFAAN